MKADIKIIIRPTFYNDDGELQEEAFSHYLSDVTIYGDYEDVYDDNYEVTLDDDTAAHINDLVAGYYNDEEYPALSHKIDFE